MKKLRVFAFIFAILFAIASTACVGLDGLDSIPQVNFTGAENEFVFTPEDKDLFVNFKGVMPGDELDQQIYVYNTSDMNVEIFMRAEPVNPEDSEFLAYFNLRVLCNNSEIFNAPANEQDGLADFVLLGSMTPNTGVLLTVELQVDLELGDEFQNFDGEIIWTFRVVEIEDEPTPGPTDEPITDEPITDEPITDEPITDEPITDEPITDEPITDEPITDEPITDEPITDEPITDEPITDEPITDEPITDEPITDEPITDEPITDEPITDEPITDEPITDEPITDEPITDEPITDEPITNEPITDEPITDEPITDEPITDEPITDEPTQGPTPTPTDGPTPPVTGGSSLFGLGIIIVLVGVIAAAWAMAHRRKRDDA